MLMVAGAYRVGLFSHTSLFNVQWESHTPDLFINSEHLNLSLLWWITDFKGQKLVI